MTDTQARRPYVGAGIDGALRSARIDLEEADLLRRKSAAFERLVASATRWEAQATEIADVATRQAIALFRRGFPRSAVEHMIWVAAEFGLGE